MIAKRVPNLCMSITGQSIGPIMAVKLKLGKLGFLCLGQVNISDISGVGWEVGVA